MKPCRLFLLALTLAVPAHAQLYKWVDADGKTVYSDTPPPANVKSQRLNVRSSGPGGAAPAAVDEKAAETRKPVNQELEFRKRRAKQDETEAKESAEAKERAENCTTARHRRQSYEDTPRVYRYDEKGERVYADEATLARLKEEAQREVDKWCR